MPPYSDSFYRELDRTALPSARHIVPLLLALMTVRSAVDIGCGDGGWLAALGERGVADILGVDGPWIAEADLKIPLACFRRAALDRPLEIDRRFDLALSLEVAEHLPPARAGDFVAELTALAPVILFSAAIPGQGGLHHLNEQWPNYWAALFAGQGFRPIDCLRPRIWDDPVIAWWYKQNLLLFANDEALALHKALARAAQPAMPLSLVHPERFDMALRQAEPRIGRWLKMAPTVLRRTFRRRDE